MFAHQKCSLDLFPYSGKLKYMYLIQIVIGTNCNFLLLLLICKLYSCCCAPSYFTGILLFIYYSGEVQ